MVLDLQSLANRRALPSRYLSNLDEDISSQEGSMKAIEEL